MKRARVKGDFGSPEEPKRSTFNVRHKEGGSVREVWRRMESALRARSEARSIQSQYFAGRAIPTEKPKSPDQGSRTTPIASRGGSVD